MAVVQITPEPTEEEAAAIVAALQLGLPGTVAPVAAQQVSRWRWSGRWWSKPVPLRRGRPA